MLSSKLCRNASPIFHAICDRAPSIPRQNQWFFGEECFRTQLIPISSIFQGNEAALTRISALMTTTYPCLAAHISAVSCRTPPVAWASAPWQKSKHFGSRKDNIMVESGSRKRKSRHSVEIAASSCGRFIPVKRPPSPNVIGVKTSNSYTSFP